MQEVWAGSFSLYRKRRDNEDFLLLVKTLFAGKHKQLVPMVSAGAENRGAMIGERGRQFMLFTFLCLLNFVSVNSV